MIFDRFTQIDGSIRRTHGGTGLGLTIARDLARLMGGDVTVKSRMGRGSAFTVTVPMQVVVPPKPVQAKAPILSDTVTAQDLIDSIMPDRPATA